MNCVLDASAAVAISLNRTDIAELSEHIEQADLLLAPDIYISEVTNVFWKYHQFNNLSLEICREALEDSMQLIDDYIEATSLYQEAFAFACQSKHSVYDSLYIVLARRKNARLLTLDKKMKSLARSHSIDVL